MRMNKFYEFQIIYYAHMPCMQKIELVHLKYDLFISTKIHDAGNKNCPFSIICIICTFKLHILLKCYSNTFLDVITLSHFWFSVRKRNFLSMHNLQQRENSCKCNQSVALLMYHILQTFIMTIALLANASLLIYDGWE